MTTTNLQIADVSESQRQKATTNNSQVLALEQALTESLALTVTTANVSLSDSQHNASLFVKLTGAMTAGRDVVFKNRKKMFLVEHACSGGFTVTLKSGSGAGSTVAMVNGDKFIVYCDGNNAVVGPFA